MRDAPFEMSLHFVELLLNWRTMNRQQKSGYSKVHGLHGGHPSRKRP